MKKYDAATVLKKMNQLRDDHQKEGTPKELAIGFAFEYGRELIGFDLCEAWRIAQL